MEIRTSRDQQAVTLRKSAILSLTRLILITPMSLQRAEASVRQPPNEIAQRLSLELEGVGVSKRDERASCDRLLDRCLWVNLAASHIGAAASTNQTLEGIGTICAVAGSDQCVGNMRPSKIASSPRPHIVPCNRKALLVEAAHHLFGTALTVDLARSGPGTERLGNRAREPGQQMTLARAVLRRQFDAGHNMDTVLDTRRLRLGDSLQRIVIGQGQHLDSPLRSKLDNEARSMATVR